MAAGTTSAQRAGAVTWQVGGAHLLRTYLSSSEAWLGLGGPNKKGRDPRSGLWVWCGLNERRRGAPPHTRLKRNLKLVARAWLCDLVRFRGRLDGRALSKRKDAPMIMMAPRIPALLRQAMATRPATTRMLVRPTTVRRTFASGPSDKSNNPTVSIPPHDLFPFLSLRG